ncbi:hypothetical protein SLEP1_g38379 [Rubroshorea leprosula]|nr:hypothetical protein SLEP1_g38379 [Rubroshorea leprosula]
MHFANRTVLPLQCYGTARKRIRDIEHKNKMRQSGVLPTE